MNIILIANTVYAVIFEGLIFRGRQFCKEFCGLIFADHQLEYSVSLSHCFFCPSKITVYTVLIIHNSVWNFYIK